MKCAHTGCGQVVQSKGWGGGRKHGHRSTGHRLIEIQMVQQEQTNFNLCAARSVDTHQMWHHPKSSKSPGCLFFIAMPLTPPHVLAPGAERLPPAPPWYAPARIRLTSFPHSSTKKPSADILIRRWRRGARSLLSFRSIRRKDIFPHFFRGKKCVLWCEKYGSI